MMFCGSSLRTSSGRMVKLTEAAKEQCKSAQRKGRNTTRNIETSESKRLISTRSKLTPVTSNCNKTAKITSPNQTGNNKPPVKPVERFTQKTPVCLPSPSTSETSDYQRSTPSPREDSGIGSSEDCTSASQTPVRNTPPDIGFSEECNADHLMRVMVALEKIPEDTIASLAHQDLKPAIKEEIKDNNPLKRRHSEEPQGLTSPSLKRRSSDPSLAPADEKLALRKEKLDRVLNLRTPESNDLVQLAQLKQLKNLQVSSTPPLSSACSSSSSPTPLRFPKPLPEMVECKWKDCKQRVESTGKLLDHLRSVHVLTQSPSFPSDDSFLYKCLWSGCKVFNKGSSSKTWLQKHVDNHGGNKPFQCIVDGCKIRFGTQTLLERHVNNHFKVTKKRIEPDNLDDAANDASNGASNSANSANSANKPDHAMVRLLRRAGVKRLKLRRTPFRARIFDLFDAGAMAKLRQQLALSRGVTGDEFRLNAEVVARRRESETGREMVLVKWKPENILADQWLPLKEAKTTLNLHSLSTEAKQNLPLPSKTTKSGRKTNTPRHSVEALS